MINGVILKKLQALDKGLNELDSLGKVTTEGLNNNWQIRRSVERNLQILVEIIIDVCQRIVSLAGQTPATTGAEAIKRCIQLGVLSDYESYGKMVQFRNFVVHRYEDIDIEILVDIVNHRLDDFRRFRDEVLIHARDRD